MNNMPDHSQTLCTRSGVSPTRAVFQKKLAGFTLIEVAIVVAIIGILAAIAWPMYTEQVRKARRSTAKAELMNIATKQEQFFLDNKRYATLLTQLGYGADTVNTPEGSWYSVTITIPAVPASNTYLLTATPRLGQVADTKCGGFTFNEKQEKKVLGTYILTPEKCW